VTFVCPVYGSVHIPDWVTDEAAFLRWKASDSFPKHVPIRFENGDVVVDLRPKNKSRVRFIHDRSFPPPADESS
jgi:hypothetical protein